MKLTIKKETVVRLFEALGFKTAKTWDEKRLQAKLKQLPELVEETKVKSPKMKRILKKVLSASEIIFKSEEPERPSEAATAEPDKVTKKKKPTAEPGKVTKKKKPTAEPGKVTKTKKKKTTAKKKEAKTAKKSEVEKDAFGRRLGTQGALIDTKLDKTPKSIKQLVKECKLSKGRISTHLRWLVEKGFVKKDKDGKYSIK